MHQAPFPFSRVTLSVLPLAFLAAVMAFSVRASATLFDDAATSIGSLVGGTATEGGYILGMVLLIGCVLLGALSLGKDPNFMFVFVGIAVIVSILVGWWESWTAIFLFFLILFAMIRPFGAKTGA